jgi:LmbE family N-acetylglucosaminyl deacetylase
MGTFTFQNLIMRKLIALSLFFISTGSFAQKQMNSSEIKLALKKLNVLGSVLYVAAHPDDENTRLIAYMANERMVRTGYLSLTRGDGGQNLIGTEKGPLMGVVRTQELLEARKVDGGEQMFTRAVDFGYSKTPEETFIKWDKQAVLADVVWAIRKFRPNVMITRFPPTSAAGHGHHTASAILAAEAFDLAGDPKAFPEQLEYTTIWQPKRLLLNASTWWDKELPEKAKANPTEYTTIDIGTYNTLLGKSYGEIAAESRTKHKSQGFGSSKQRGSKLEYLKLTKGEPFKTDVLDGINLSWNSIKNGEAIEKLLSKASLDFNPEKPELVVPTLLQAYKLIDKLPNSNKEKLVKLSNLNSVISACAGLFIEVTANDYSTTSGNEIELTTTLINRSNLKIELESIKYDKIDTAIIADLSNNIPLTFKSKITCPQHINNKSTNPYWLNNTFEGLYTVPSQNMIGNPENNSSFPVYVTLKINDVYLPIVRNITYKWTDRVKGEIYRPFFFTPKVTANIADPVYVFSDSQPKDIRVTVKGHQAKTKGSISIKLPEGWKSEPSSIAYEFEQKNQEKVIVFSVTPSQNESTGSIDIIGENSLISIEYDHIPIQTLLPEASAKVVRLNVAIKGKKIGYIKGAGDEVPTALEQLGYQIVMLDENSLKNNDLSEYDAIIAGIRAYNTNKYMPNLYSRLMKYVEAGGNYVVQYNTNRGVDTKTLAPYPLELSRDRVTEEDAPVTILAPEDHPILNSPNKITEKDFENWVQERGLYFPNKWDEKYTPILGWNDTNSPMTKGSLLVTNYGKGTFIYTGISFFRELPAGVPGAFKLLSNIVSYGK